GVNDAWENGLTLFSACFSIADSTANNVTPVDPDALPVAMRPMARHPDVARAVMNVIWAVRVIRSIPDRNNVAHVWRWRTGRPVIYRRACAAHEHDAEQDDE